MRGKIIENVTILSNWMLPQIIKKDMRCIDATVGNGHDTLFLSERIGANGFVYGFDVQSVAVESTLKRLEESPHQNYKIICDGHEKMADYVEEAVDFIFFNLGYLPRADKMIKTNKVTTLKAIEAAMSLLKCHGILWVVVYPGHEEGQEESLVLEDFFKQLDQKSFSVLKMAFMNQKNNPPYIWAIEKKIEMKISGQ